MKGFAAEETKAVLVQTLGLAAQSDNVAERMKAHYARWIALYTGGELASAHEAAEGFLREAKLAGDAPAAAYAGRVLGQTCLFQGRFAEAREQLREALRVYSPGWDASVRRQLGSDAGTGAKAFLAMVAWHVGDATGAAAQFEAALTEALASEHVPTIANNLLFKALHEMLRGDAEATLRAAHVVLDIAEKTGLRLYKSAAHMFLSWAQVRLGDADGLARFRGHGETAVNRDAPLFAPLFHGRLAELEAEQTSLDAALASIDRAIELARAGDIRYIDALLHRIRGDVLLKADPANPARAEEAYLAAIAVAREQGARSFGLLAALKLAKLYQIHRPPGRSPRRPRASPRRLFADAGDGGDRRGAGAARHARRDRQSKGSGGGAGAQAEIADQLRPGDGLVEGFAADETKAVLAQTLGLAAQSDNVAERMKAHFARWVALYVGGELESAHEAAEVFLREAKLAGDAPTTVSAERALGHTCLFQGRFAEARQHLREALRVYSPGWEASARRLHGTDAGITAKAALAWVAWHFGDATGAAAQFEEASTEALASEHVPTIALTFAPKAAYEMARGNSEATLRSAKVLSDVSEKNVLRLYENQARMFLYWARARLGAADGLAQFRGHGETCISQGAAFLAPLFHGRLAELEAEQTSVEEALASIDRAIELARAGDIRYIDALLHRIRGDILLRRDPANAAPAEEAFLVAIAVAREQGARSFGLQGALKLAKLYQSTARPVEAHDILAPALEGFAPTPEMPEMPEIAKGGCSPRSPTPTNGSPRRRRGSAG